MRLQSLLSASAVLGAGLLVSALPEKVMTTPLPYQAQVHERDAEKPEPTMEFSTIWTYTTTLKTAPTGAHEKPSQKAVLLVGVVPHTPFKPAKELEKDPPRAKAPPQEHTCSKPASKRSWIKNILAREPRRPVWVPSGLRYSQSRRGWEGYHHGLPGIYSERESRFLPDDRREPIILLQNRAEMQDLADLREGYPRPGLNPRAYDVPPQPRTHVDQATNHRNRADTRAIGRYDRESVVQATDQRPPTGYPMSDYTNSARTQYEEYPEASSNYGGNPLLMPVDAGQNRRAGQNYNNIPSRDDPCDRNDYYEDFYGGSSSPAERRRRQDAISASNRVMTMRPPTPHHRGLDRIENVYRDEDEARSRSPARRNRDRRQ